MKDCTLFRSRKYDRIQKVLLALILMGAVVTVSTSIRWTYLKMSSGVGEEAAQVTVALQVTVVLVIVMFSMGSAYLVNWAILHQRFIFRIPLRGRCVEAIVRIWGYEVRCQERLVDLDQAIPKSELPAGLESLTIISDKPRRRGRKPTFPLERWLPIAAKWENRDPIRDAFTLGELIAEHLGTNSDGTPIVSEQAYYTTWRPRALDELNRLASIQREAIHAKGRERSSYKERKP